MTEIVNITLENEMDLILANKRTIKICDHLNLSLSSQTTFTTAVSEMAREIIEKVHYGVLSIGLRKNSFIYQLIAQIRYDGTDNKVSEASGGFLYAKRLMSQFRVFFENPLMVIEIKINLPKNGKLNEGVVVELQDYFNGQTPDTPYEELKQKNFLLSRQAEKQKEQLLQSYHLNEKKSEFLSIASHELKTPLTTIKAFAQLALASDEECGEEIKGYLTNIERQASKLNILIKQLLDFSKVENGKMDVIIEETSFNKLVQDVIRMNQSILPNHLLVLNLNGDVNVRVDRIRIEQVFSNILGNGAKYSAANTKITISSSILDGFVKVVIADEGIGLSKENASRIFEKFYREDETSKKYTGFGMGLYITAQIIKEHRGNIWVESEPGSGATFCFTLPIVLPV